MRLGYISSLHPGSNIIAMRGWGKGSADVVIWDGNSQARTLALITDAMKERDSALLVTVVTRRRGISGLAFASYEQHAESRRDRMVLLRLR